MDESRTIVINGDPTWPFADLLWAHGLDLYPPATGVSFITAQPPKLAAPGNEDYRRIMGNFPESFGDDQAALANEIAGELLSLDQGVVESLAILGIVSAGDFDRMADWKPEPDPSKREEREAELSPAGRTTVRALMAAIERMDELSGDQGRISRLLPKMWLALAVRERGYDQKHKAQAQTLANSLAGQNTGLRTVFFLSNGRGLDSEIVHPHQHFLKLRLTIDLLQHATDRTIAKELKSTGSGPSVVTWLLLPQGTPPYFDHSAALLSALVEAYENLVAGEQDTVKVEETFTRMSKELLQDIEPAMSLDMANGQLSKSHDDTLEKLALSYRQGREETFLRDPRRVDRIETDARTFDNELKGLGEALDQATEARLDAEAKDQLTRRRRVVNGLAILRRPYAESVVEDFLSELAERAGGLEHGVAEANAASARLVDGNGSAEAAVEARERSQRDSLRQRLIDAEQNLLAPVSLIKVPLILALIAFVPLSINFFGLWINRTFPGFAFSDLWDSIRPIPHILLLILALSLVLGLGRAFVISRRRDRARRAYGDALLAAYKRRIDNCSWRLIRGVHTLRLTSINLISSRLGLAHPVAITNATDSLLKNLATTRHIQQQAPAGPPNIADEVTASARKGFDLGLLRPEKVAGFLRSIGSLPEAQLPIDLPGGRQGIEVMTRISRQPPRLRLVEPGDG